MKRCMTLIIILVGISLTTICYASPLKVEISLNEHFERSKFNINPANLDISTRIINVSDVDQRISVWNCSYGYSWVASSPAIVSGLEGCLSNYDTEIILKPGEEYKRHLQIAVSSKAKTGPLTFQMGFNLKNDWIGTRCGIEPSEEVVTDVIWSNPITVNINYAMLVLPKKCWPAKVNN